MVQIQALMHNREQWLSFAREKGLSFEVLELSTPACLSDKKLSGRVEEWYKDTGLATSVHGAFIDINPASSDEDFAVFSMRKCMNSCEQAVRMKARNIVFHSSCFSILRGPYLESWAEKSAAFFSELSRKYDLNIFIENSQDLDPGPIRTLLQMCNNPRIRACFDTGHANCSPTPLSKWFSELKDYIGYIHLSDNMGHYDDHMLLGSGTVNWKKLDACYRSLPEERRKNMIMTFECGDLTSVKNSYDFLEKNNFMGFGNPDAVHSDVRYRETDSEESLIEDLALENVRLQQKNQNLFDTFGHFLSDDILRSVIDVEGNSRLGGEVMELTVLLSDIRGFSALSESMETDKVLDMLSHYFDRMVEEVRKNNGTVTEFAGDSVLAVFGAPIALENHADNAVMAAICMQKAMEDVNSWNWEHGYPTLEMGIGINTGELIVGNIGCRKLLKYGVIGNAINMCSRIEGLTVGNQVFISPTTKEKLTLPLELAGENTIYPKGFKQPVTVYDVRGLNGVSFSPGAHEMRKLQSGFKCKFRMLNDKIVRLEQYDAFFIMFGHSDAVFSSIAKLKVFDDVKLALPCGRLYGKIVDVMEERGPLTPMGRYHIRFTSHPAGFDKWYESSEM
ncbi:MAG: TIM barrel protein [Sphaerochaetaceae bacterium]|nr:TIM barrel protein [Sphaerochaetaceae bacterium]